MTRTSREHNQWTKSSSHFQRFIFVHRVLIPERNRNLSRRTHQKDVTTEYLNAANCWNLLQTVSWYILMFKSYWFRAPELSLETEKVALHILVSILKPYEGFVETLCCSFYLDDWESRGCWIRTMVTFPLFISLLGHNLHSKAADLDLTLKLFFCANSQTQPKARSRCHKTLLLLH